jgi:hypothetical protein
VDLRRSRGGSEYFRAHVLMLAANRLFFDSSLATAGPRALNDLVRRMVLKEVLNCLAGRGIPVMPLKGALLAYTVYDDPRDRRVSDIDLLVPESAFEASIGALAANGYQPMRQTQYHERMLCASGVPIPIDLHRTLFPRGRFRLSTKEIFARGLQNTVLYGTSVVLPDPYDAYAHLIGHEACHHRMPIDPRTSKDLFKLASRHSLDSGQCAAHIDRVGLARAARYALFDLSREDPFAFEVFEKLRHDSVGDFLASTARAWTMRFTQESIPSRVAGHMTNSSLLLAARAICEPIANRLNYWRAWRKLP